MIARFARCRFIHKFGAIYVYTMRRSNDSSFWLPKILPNVHAELASTVRVVSLSWHKMEQPAGGSTAGKRARGWKVPSGSAHFHHSITVEGATTMQATTTFRARACAPAGLTARRARTHRVKAFTAPRTRTVAARPVVVVRAADGASPRGSPVVNPRAPWQKGHPATSAETSPPRRDPPNLDLR